VPLLSVGAVGSIRIRLTRRLGALGSLGVPDGAPELGDVVLLPCDPALRPDGESGNQAVGMNRRDDAWLGPEFNTFQFLKITLNEWADIVRA
jgi:hypothetical protein